MAKDRTKYGQLTLFSCVCDKKQVDKDNKGYLENPTKVPDFVIKEPCSMLNPVLQITGSASGDINLNRLNFAYMKKFDRYYFIEDIIYQKDGLVELHLAVDVLTTYGEQILSSQQEVVRSWNVNTRQYTDPERPIYFTRWLDATNSTILGKVPDSTGNNYVMTVAGGN